MSSLVSGRLAGVVGVVAATALACVLTGCVRMPNSGPVVESGVDGWEVSASSTSYEPPSPASGASRRQIVQGFLQAMRAIPLSTEVGSSYLTDAAAALWMPQNTVITYASATTTVDGDVATVVLSGAHRYDRRGDWQGAVPEERATYRFPLVEERGQWRIAKAPQHLLVSDAWFAENVERIQLYFLDSSGELLVPEPVHYPAGEMQVDHMVRGLLAGPDRSTRGVVTTAWPSDVVMTANRVVVDEQGVVQVSLRGPSTSFAEGVSDKAAAQLAWTLRQADDVSAFSVTYNGRLVPFSDGSVERSVNAATSVVPYGSASVPGTFEFAGGRLLRGLPSTQIVATTGPFGSGLTPVRSIGVHLDGRSVMAVDPTGTRLYTGPVESVRSSRGGLRTVLRGRTDLLEPSNDAAGRTWVVDRTEVGAEVLLVVGRRSRVVEVPGITGRRDVTSVQVSPDGTRLAFLTGKESGAGARISVARVEVDDAAGSVRVPVVRRVGEHLPADQPILDMVWSSQARLGVLLDTGEEVLAVRLVAAEGSPDTFQETPLLRARAGNSGLAMSSIPGAKSYVYSGSVVRDLDDVDRPIGELDEEVDWFGYPG